jgi:protein SCO1/2
MTGPLHWANALRAARGAGAALLAALALLLASTGGVVAQRWGKSYFPDAKVVTQDGKTLRFYDDLIRDKVFVISFLFTTCKDVCPLATARLAELQDKLGTSMGRDIFFYSISIDPETDTPARLKQYAAAFGAGPGWLFLTGAPDEIRAIRHKLGDRSKVLSDHRNEVLLGNGATGEWARNSVLGDLESVALAVRSMDPKWRPAAGASRPPQAIKVDLAARPGQALYKRLCAGCHSVGKGDRVGPDLAGILGRRDRDWLVGFIADPDKMRAQKDPAALELAARFPAVRMPAMGITPRDAADLIAYMVHLDTDEADRVQPLAALSGLTTQSGVKFAAETVKGEAVAVFFGFTHCPDVCPTTLLDWSNVLAGLGKDGDRLKVLFVSVDGERDTPAALSAYMASFDPRIVALTGGTAEIARAARAFDALYEKVAGGDGSHSFDHTTKVYLVGRDGRLAATADLQTPEAERRKMLAGLLARR